MADNNDNSKSLVLAAGQGRVYHLGPMTAIFKADGDETGDRYSISEWWLAPRSEGPGAHQHDDQDQVFYVLEGVISILVGEQWINAGKGSFVRIPRHTLHTFANRTDQKAGMLNIDVPGGFERNMPSMVKWFEENK
jgi:quercetin dioxygenase-like cupin family protein